MFLSQSLLTLGRSAFLIFFMLYAANSLGQTTGGIPPVRNSGASKSPDQTKPERRDQSRSSRATETEQPFDPSALVREGWAAFIGSDGVVDERRAFNLTLEAINTLSPMLYSLELDVAKNNLSVFYLCATDLSVRDYQKGIAYADFSSFVSNLSQDNFVWGVFIKRHQVRDEAEFYQLIKTKRPTHPVNKYIDFLNGKPPDSAGHAYSILERFASEGDPYAATRMGFRFECSDKQPDIPLALSWYRKARSLHEKSSAPSSRIKSLSDRINRLALILDGKVMR